MRMTPSPQTEAMIRQRIAAGSYRDVDELIEDALRPLDERDRLARLRAAIASSDVQIARDVGGPYTDDVLDEIEREAEETLLRGDLPDPDVCPSATAADASGGFSR